MPLSISVCYSVFSCTVKHKRTAWRSSRSCCLTWAWCDSQGVWQTPPQASAGPWWKSEGHLASRRGPPTSQSRYCQRPKHTHTHAQTQVRGASSPSWRGKGQRVGGSGGGSVASAEEDAVPLHLNTVKFYSDHILTGPCVKVSVCSVSVWDKGAGRVYCHKSITML